MTATDPECPGSGPDSDPLIRVEEFSFRYPGSDELVLDGASLGVHAGEFLAVLGGNGSGKTTLCKSFNGLIPNFFEGATEGRVVVDGVDTADASVGELSRTVGYVYQDFDNQLVQPTVRQDVEFGPLNYGFEDYTARAERALERLGLEDLADAFIWELSGGQKHLVALAGVLALNPEVVVVDEPAAQLDPTNARRVYDTLAALNDEGHTVVTIEHDTELVAEYADRVALVDDGAVRWTAPTGEALNRVDELRERDIHPPQVTELCEWLDGPLPRGTDDDGPVQSETADHRPVQSETADDEPSSPGAAESVPDHRYPVTVAEAVAALNGRAVTVPDGAGPTAPERSDRSDRRSERESDRSDRRRERESDRSDREPVVELAGVHHGYLSMHGDAVTVLEDLSLTVGSDERVALVGANGAGKSTVLKLVTGLIAPDEGTVTVAGTETADSSPEELADEVVYVHQQPEEMFVEDCVEKDVAYYLRQRDRTDVDAVVGEVLEYLDLEHLREADGRLLSVGQQRRASLAIGLAMEPSVVLLDEPTGCLDVESRREVATMLDRVDNRVDAVVVATHDLQFVASWADRVVVLEDGAVVADAPPAEALVDPAVVDVAALRPPQPVELSRELGVDPPATTVDELAERLGEST